MNCRFCIFSIILLFMIQTLDASDFYLLSSGTLKNSHVNYDMYRRKWRSTPGIKLWGKTATADSNGNDGLIDPTPFSTAVLSRSIFSIRFKIKKPGRKYVRLYFYSNNFGQYVIRNANFSVLANEKVLLDLPAEHIDYSQTPSCVIYEFSVTVISDHITIVFAPTYEFPYTFAFINGIEIVSHPDIYSGTKTLIGSYKKFIITNQTLEKIARVNVGGEQIHILDDSGHLFRFWDTDERFLASGQPGIKENSNKHNITVIYPPPNFSEYVAPKILYQTARSMLGDTGNNLYLNMEWRFGVDPGNYYYLVRLHFCEVSGHMNMVNDRVFGISINSKLAESKADVIAWTGKPGVPVYKDYVVFLSDSDDSVIWINLQPNSNSKHYDTILNGIEIFKISDRNGDLDVDIGPIAGFRTQT